MNKTFREAMAVINDIDKAIARNKREMQLVKERHALMLKYGDIKDVWSRNMHILKHLKHNPDSALETSITMNREACLDNIRFHNYLRKWYSGK